MWKLRWLREQVVVNLKDGTAISGTLVGYSLRHGVELANATVHDPASDKAVPAIGVQWVPAGNIAFITRTS